MMTNFNVIDDNFLFSDWHNESENRQTLLDKKDTSGDIFRKCKINESIYHENSTWRTEQGSI